MTIIRRRRSENFTVVPNEIYDSEAMSFEASSLLAYLLTRPQNWKVHTNQLKKVTGFGRDKVQKLMQQIRAAGYAKTQPKQAKNGRFSGQETIIFDEVQCAEPGPDFQGYRDGEPDLPEPDLPCDGKSGPIISTDTIISTDSLFPPIIPPPGDEPVSSEFGFEEFWATFADKRGRQAALRLWKRKQLSKIAAQVIDGAARYAMSRTNDRRYWKQAQGWLNDGRWEDEQLVRKKTAMDVLRENAGFDR